MTDADIDSYLLKCTLESLSKNISLQEIQGQCKCQMGFLNCAPDGKKIQSYK